MAVYEITQPKLLSEDDWEGLRGTALYETMFRNRVHIELSEGSLEHVEAAEEAIVAWLEEHVQKLYYLDNSNDFIYFEDAAEMVAFTLAHAGEEAPEPKKDVGRPVKPHRSGPGFPPPQVNPPHRSGGGKPWGFEEGIWESRMDDDDLWRPLRVTYGDDIRSRVYDILKGGR